MRLPASIAPPVPAEADAGSERVAVLPVSRRITLGELLQAAPPQQGDIGIGASGLPLMLRLQLLAADGSPMRHAVVCIWQHDRLGWTLDFDGDELDAVARMRGMQIADEQGWVSFRTVYPGAYRDGNVVVYLQIYLHDGRRITARADLALHLPTHVDGPVRGIPLAQPMPGRVDPPRCSPDRPLGRALLPQLGIDSQVGGLRGQMRLFLTARPLFKGAQPHEPPPAHP